MHFTWVWTHAQAVNGTCYKKVSVQKRARTNVYPMYTYTHVCAYSAFTHTYYAYIHTCMHTYVYIHTYIHTYTQAEVLSSAKAHLAAAENLKKATATHLAGQVRFVSTRVLVRTCVRQRDFVCVHIYIYIYIYEYIHVYKAI